MVSERGWLGRASLVACYVRSSEAYLETVLRTAKHGRRPKGDDRLVPGGAGINSFISRGYRGKGCRLAWRLRHLAVCSTFVHVLLEAQEHVFASPLVCSAERRWSPVWPWLLLGHGVPGVRGPLARAGLVGRLDLGAGTLSSYARSVTRTSKRTQSASPNWYASCSPKAPCLGLSGSGVRSSWPSVLDDRRLKAASASS